MPNLGLGLSVTKPNFSGASDPLAGILFALRLQTHNGNNVPLGLYKDVACTLPATQEGDSIAAWRDKLSGSGLAATQSNSMKRPTLHFVDGVPTVLLDEVDDGMLTDASATGDWCITILEIPYGPQASTRTVNSATESINALISPHRHDNAYYIDGNVADSTSEPVGIPAVVSMGAFAGHTGVYVNGEFIGEVGNARNFGSVAIGTMGAYMEPASTHLISLYVYSPEYRVAVETYQETLKP